MEQLYTSENHVFNIGKVPDDIDDMLMEVEYAVEDLCRYANDAHELSQMECLRGIIYNLVSVIRRMK